jgi:integrase
MPKLLNRVPSYCRHRASGQAVVTLDGKDRYLGKYGTADSRREYDRLIAEWTTAGRRLPDDPAAITVAEIFAAWRHHARTYYRSADGQVSSEYHNVSDAMRPVLKLYGKTPAAAFGPVKLNTVRESMITAGRVRTAVNRGVSRIKTVFKWAVANELIPPDVYHGLAALAGLRTGRSEAKESEPVTPVSEADISAVLAHLPPIVAAMVQVQRLTGARPGEVCAMTTAAIDTTGAVWIYRPAQHKTAIHGHPRTIHIGPKAQAVLQSHLKPLNPAAHIFRPADTLAEMRQNRHDTRKTPINQGNRPGYHNGEKRSRRRRQRQPGEAYNIAAYRRAIARAADMADLWAKGGLIVANDKRLVPHWHPHQLRHSAATDIRRQFGIEAAQHVLGHATLKVTELYAEKNADVTNRVALAIG